MKTALAKAQPTPTVPAGTGKLLPHPLSETVPGEMSEEEFDALCLSIKADGLQTPIILFEGKILDGRARYRACQRLGVQGRFQTFDGKLSPISATNLVLANNLHRRQLNSMQKAIVAARMHLNEEHPTPQKEAAQFVGIGSGTVNLAVRLLQSNNTPLIKRVESGNCTRAEIDEILYDRAAQQQAKTAQDNEDDLIGDGTGIPSSKVTDNVHDITSRLPTRPDHSERKPVETTASQAVKMVKGLAASEQKSFVEMSWGWLEPLLIKMNKLPKPVKVPAGTVKPGVPAKTQAVPKAKPTAKAKSKTK